MESHEIQVGDVVKLKSGGAPRMTVEEIRDGKAQCAYFDDKSRMVTHSPWLQLSTLRKLAPPVR